jgi:hypothetical protein
MPYHAGFRDASKYRKANSHACFRRYDPSKPPTRFTEDPISKTGDGSTGFKIGLQIPNSNMM